MNKLEQLQNKINGTHFIKSYPMLKRLDISEVQKSFIELVLSFQHKDLEFYMEYSDIAELIGIKTQSVSNLVKKLKSNNFIITKKKSFHKNNKFIGSKSLIKVNEDYIIELISKTLIDTPNIDSNDTLGESEVVLPEVIKEVVKQKINEIPSNNKKEEFRKKYNNIFKNQEGKMLPVQFNALTNNVFYGMTQLSIADRMLPKDDFEIVWDKIQEYKKLIKNK